MASGEVLESHLGIDDQENENDMDFSLESTIYGTNAVVGMIEFMLGSTGVQGATKAWSTTVVMRRVAIPFTDAPFVPLVLPGTTPSESGIFYSYMAHQMLARLRSIRTTLAKAASVSNTKRDIKTGLNVLNENKILARINKRFGFPMSEQLIYTGYATLALEDLNLHLNSLGQGRFCLFSTWIVFLSKRGWKGRLGHMGRDVLIPIRNIASAEVVDGNRVVITLESSDDTEGISRTGSMSHMPHCSPRSHR